MTKHPTATILIIVGITGDLSRRKLLPALAHLMKADKLPEKFKIVGVSRRPIDIDQLMDGQADADKELLRPHLEGVSFNLAQTDDYQILKDKLDVIEKKLGGRAERLFYLSVPPEISKPLVEHLGQAGLAKVPGTKLLLEKPFGTDETSARELVEHIEAHFHEDQVYRIDHYLAKEMAQNILVFRRDNSLFKQTWNSQFIESIEVVAAEAIGIEGRTQFYEQTGALRDTVQSHLLQLAALVLMDTADPQNLGSVPGARLKALTSLLPAGPDLALRAQYEEYAVEVENPGSLTETFAQATIFSSDERWVGVPIRLMAGKALDGKYTEIRINYRKTADHESNELVLRLQPHEGVKLFICVKEPGFDRRIERQRLKFAYDQETVLPEAYEHVLLDAMRSDHSLFATSDEVMASWRVIQPLIEAWANEESIPFYAKGSKPEDITA